MLMLETQKATLALSGLPKQVNFTQLALYIFWHLGLQTSKTKNISTYNNNGIQNVRKMFQFMSLTQERIKINLGRTHMKVGLMTNLVSKLYFSDFYLLARIPETFLLFALPTCFIYSCLVYLSLFYGRHGRIVHQRIKF